MALLTGAISGAAVALTMGVISWLTRMLWGDPVEEGLERQIPLLWSMGVCGGVGVALALLHRRGPATLLPELPETIQELRHPETAPRRRDGHAILGASLSLVGGGSVGPEALMTRLATLISQRIWKGRDQDLQLATVAGSLGMFGLPLLGGAVVHDGTPKSSAGGSGQRSLIDRWIPGSLGGIAGFAAFHGMEEVSGGSLRQLPYSWPSNLGEDLGSLSAGLLAGVAGWGLGWLLLHWRTWLEQRQLLAHWPWWPVVTGLLLGVWMHWLPLVPFAGEEQLRPLLEGVNRSSAPVLLVSALIKLVMLGLCLETGWRGGIFFPVFLIACAAGTGLHELSPNLGSLGSWCGGVTGAFYLTVLRSPLVALVLGVGLLQGHGATAVVLGVAVAWLITHQSRPGDAPPLAPQTPDSP
jgi:H+/Cl- antiporter ClcA